MKLLRIRNKLYLAACLLGILICTLKAFPLSTWTDSSEPSGALAIGLCALTLYFAGYCLYRAVMVVNEYFTYSDLR